MLMLGGAELIIYGYLYLKVKLEANKRLTLLGLKSIQMIVIHNKQTKVESLVDTVKKNYG